MGPGKSFKLADLGESESATASPQPLMQCSSPKVQNVFFESAIADLPSTENEIIGLRCLFLSFLLWKD